jgi:hypothetical protein
MQRTTARVIKIATLALTCSTAIAFAATTADASPAVTANRNTATAISKCKIVITAAPWHVGAHAGNKYTIAGEGTPCTAASAWVRKATYRSGNAPIKGPPGFVCRSFSTTVSGDKLQYSGVCMRPPHNKPFIEWAPSVG